MDEDLNRQFAADRLLSGPDAKIWEQRRAAELDRQLGPKLAASPAMDLVLDLHTTTANMGVTLVAHESDVIGMAACAFAADGLMADHGTEVRVLLENTSREQSPFLFSVGRHGVLVEVGPISTGLVEAGVVTGMRLASEYVLQFFERCNWHAAMWHGIEATLEERIAGDAARGLPPAPFGGGHRDWFMDSGDKIAPPPAASTAGGPPVTAMFHPDLQGCDWSVLQKGQPLFETPAGETIAYDGTLPAGAVPIFINEAGYQNASSGAGFGIAFEKRVSLPGVAADPASLHPDCLPQLRSTVP